jgi:D-sedoheptulose 7-phosphate isomerase
MKKDRAMAETAQQGAGPDWTAWLDEYNARYEVAFSMEHRQTLRAFHDLAVRVRASGNKLIFAGNGASASISSHGRVDFTKQAKVNAVDFNEPNLITAFSNDYGYENWIAKALDFFAVPGDAVVLISVSGRSPNIVKAAEYARANQLPVVGFSGSAPDNPLRRLSDIDFYLPSRAYNVVECVHMIWLTTVVDMVVGRAEYSVS